MHKIISFPGEKCNLKKYACLPYLKFSDRYPKHTYFFLFGLMQIVIIASLVFFRFYYRRLTSLKFKLFIIYIILRQKSNLRFYFLKLKIFGNVDLLPICVTDSRPWKPLC